MRTPDLEGPAGRAWRSPLEGHGVHATLSAWLVNVPGAHPFWSWWTVGVVHLRELEGFPPPHKRYPEAAYEFMIFAINPEQCPEPDPDDVGHPLLTPPDVIEQFHGVLDADVVHICDLAVKAVVDGRISPDQDYRAHWHQVLTNTVEHFRQGLHAVN